MQEKNYPYNVLSQVFGERVDGYRADKDAVAQAVERIIKENPEMNETIFDCYFKGCRTVVEAAEELNLDRATVLDEVRKILYYLRRPQNSAQLRKLF